MTLYEACLCPRCGAAIGLVGRALQAIGLGLHACPSQPSQPSREIAITLPVIELDDDTRSLVSVAAGALRPHGREDFDVACAMSDLVVYQVIGIGLDVDPASIRWDNRRRREGGA